MVVGIKSRCRDRRQRPLHGTVPGEAFGSLLAYYAYVSARRARELAGRTLNDCPGETAVPLSCPPPAASLYTNIR